MPIFRYFFLVGGSLLALLFAADRYLPQPFEGGSAVDVDRSIIRIRSAWVGPEKIEFDTAHPPRPLPVNQVEQRDDRPRESFAMIPEADPRQAQPVPVARKGDGVRTAHARRKVRKVRTSPERLIALDHLQPSAW
jgi:hypothetical protein